MGPLLGDLCHIVATLYSYPHQHTRAPCPHNRARGNSVRGSNAMPPGAFFEHTCLIPLRPRSGTCSSLSSGTPASDGGWIAGAGPCEGSDRSRRDGVGERAGRDPSSVRRRGLPGLGQLREDLVVGWPVGFVLGWLGVLVCGVGVATRSAEAPGSAVSLDEHNGEAIAPKLTCHLALR